MDTFPETETDFERCRNIQAKCMHPTGHFIEFWADEIEQSIPARFEQQVTRYPNNLAIKTEDRQITYRELNKAANRVAGAILSQRGEGQESIGLMLDHGISILVGILGVLKAGKIYTPLDPSFPRNRLKYILENSQASCIVTDSQNCNLATELSNRQIQAINISELDPNLSIENPDLSISPDALANILYTSGSTGQPKGVLQNHRNLLHQIRVYTNDFHICAEDRLPLFISCGFAASVKVFLGALLNGASLFPYNLKQGGLANLADWLVQEELTIYFSVTTTFRQFINTLSGEDNFPKLRLIMVGAEPVRRKDVEFYGRFFSKDCFFIVTMGATEAGTVCWYFIDRETEISQSIVPVGYTVEDIDVILLDNTGKEVEAGKIGEICVNSRYLSPGYWEDPILTETSFLPNPEDADRRIYHTGDLGYILPDGCLMHLGRRDSQVKIRGYRIDAAEIEMALLEHNAIEETVVIAHKTSNDNMGLVAYFVSVTAQVPTVTEIRKFLSGSLPDYMIPSIFVKLDALPVSPTGKLNYQALPAPDNARPNLGVSPIKPRNKTENRLVKVWKEVLGIHPIGVRDNFYDLGGNSILAAHLFTQIQKAFGKTVPASVLLQASNIEQQAEILNQKKTLSSSSLMVEIQPGGNKRPLFNVHNCLGEVLIYRDLARSLGPEQPFYALKPQGMYGEKLPYTCFEDMAARFIEEMQAVQPEGPYFLSSVGIGGSIALEMAQQLQKKGQKVDILILMDAIQHALVNQGISPGKNQSISDSGNRKLLDRYTGRFIHSLKKGRLFRSFRNIIKRQIKKYYWKFAYSSISRNISFIKNNIDYIQHVRKVLVAAESKYIPKTYPDKIVYFLSEALKDQLHSNEWHELSTGKLDIHIAPGFHGEMLKEPHVQVVAEKLKSYLD